MKKRTNSIVGVVVLLLTSGCVMNPEYQRPELPVAESFSSQFIDKDLIATSGSSAADVSAIGWQDVFVDPVLQRLVESALENNRDLRETALNVQSYQAQYRIQRSAMLPGVTAGGSGKKQRTLSGAGRATSESYTLEVGTTSYELDLFGRIASLEEDALEQYLAMAETRKSGMVSLVAEVARTYLTLLADRELLHITEQTYKVEGESYELVRQRVKAGVGNELELNQASSSLESVRANLAMYQRYVAQDIHYLAVLAGTSLPDSVIHGDEMLSGMESMMVVPKTLSSKVLFQRPDIMAAEHELMAANANIGAARAAFFPTISLMASAGVISSDLSDLFDSGSGSWLFSPSISVPIFNAGRLQAELDVAKIRKEMYISRYENVIQTAFQEVSDSLVGLATYKEQLEAQQANLEANRQYFSHAMDRYQQGVDSFLTLLDAQRSLYSSKQDYVSITLAKLENQVNLYKALGGGWK